MFPEDIIVTELFPARSESISVVLRAFITCRGSAFVGFPIDEENAKVSMYPVIALLPRQFENLIILY